jgi:phospholipid/cholesterol/gamma-HCH transport system substrate-binding protein
MSRNRLAAVGAFVLGGVLLFAVGLFLIGSRRLLFHKTFEVRAEFSRIAALDSGATVRVAGMDAGEVETIEVPAGPAQPFRVTMRVRSDLHPLIRLDSVASIQNDGLVGNKFVEIHAGSEKSPILQDGGTIQSREPLEAADLLEKMSDTVDAINATIADVKGEVDTTLAAISETAGIARSLMYDIGQQARAIMTTGHRITADVQTIVTGVREGRGTVGKLLQDDAVFQSARKIAIDAERAMADVRDAGAQVKAAVADLRRQGGSAGGVVANLQQTLATARDVMADLAENTEALKHNFFFRGFFNRRGYFDLDDVTVQQYRQGALETKDRRVLRIWIRDDLLFEPAGDGKERLSEEGQRRLDSAMSQYVRYPKTSPFVVEGYAEELTGEGRFLLSQSRAQLVRDYVLTKFGLDRNFVAIMPMGEEAVGSPAGRTWSGVALAIFVPRSAR